jgi:hypothetical protein
LGLTLLNHQTRIAATTPTNKIVSFIGLAPVPELREAQWGRAMAKRSKPSLLIANLGRREVVFDEDDVVHLLRAAVEREGSQVAFAKRHGLDRPLVNMILNGKRPVSDVIVKALGLRRVYVAE